MTTSQFRAGHPGPDGPRSDADLTEILTRLRSIRTEISALTAQDHRPVGDMIVHELDEVIQRTGQAASGPVNDQERPPRPGSRHDMPHLPSGPDYPAPTYRHSTATKA